ncbi:MAG: DEAD/DEAH box helicase family protein [Prevotellaceae bacterium]|nr:DEAD/DEAH box helicase family protein [Prevotellaceae bacterium]
MDADAIMRRLHELEEENKRLKSLLAKHGIPFEVCSHDSDIAASPIVEPIKPSVRLSLQEKVELFRSLFKGREDVFAKRWYSDMTKKSGYQPVCEREWNWEFCDKRKYKCTECPNRKFSALSYEHIYNHLAGKNIYGRDVVGLYPILNDNTCFFLCTDFDDKSCEHGYQNNVLAFTNVCKDWNIPCYIERSRSGNGAHVWVFFDNAVTTIKARRLGKSILSKAMNEDVHLSFKSYDRFFPNQDTLPEGGFGNLVALPLQGQARRNGNSVFVDEKFQAYPDQWEFLLYVQKISGSVIDDILQKHTSSLGELTKSSESKPWETPELENITTSDFPVSITLTRANMLFIPLSGLTSKIVNLFKRMAAFHNPKFYAKQGMRLSTYDVPRIISCSDLLDDYLTVPRGCEDDIVGVLKTNDVNYIIEDKTCHGCEINVSFKGKLREEQQKAMEYMIPYNTETLSATTAFGKTVFAIAMIAQRKVNTLILVHRKSLLDQWKKQLEEFLEIKEVVDDNLKRKRKIFSPIGELCSGKDSIHGVIDIALIQSCQDGNEVRSLVQNYGMVIVDECHHVSSVSFEQVLKQVRAYYVYGLTATPIRKDGHQPIIFMQCGKIRYTADAKSQMDRQSFIRKLIPRFTSFRNISSETQTYTQAIEALSTDEVRNKLIVEDIKKTVDEGRTPIILTNLTSHVRILAEMLQHHATHVIRLVGADSAKEKNMAMERLEKIPTTESLIIVATGKHIGEGFDYPRLDTLFLALPISWKGNIAQYAGRLHRDYAGKNEVCIYDYVDIRVSLCDSMYRKRLRGYASVGYGIPKLSDKNEVLKQELIYDGQTFSVHFQQDLLAMKHSIVISCKKIKYKYTPRLVSLLRDLMANDIEVVVHIKEQGYNEKDLQEAGIEVLCDKELSVHCAIIDKYIVWYGNVNFFGYNTEDNNVMRINDSSIADELLNVVCLQH